MTFKGRKMQFSKKFLFFSSPRGFPEPPMPGTKAAGYFFGRILKRLKNAIIWEKTIAFYSLIGRILKRIKNAIIWEKTIAFYSLIEKYVKKFLHIIFYLPTKGGSEIPVFVPWSIFFTLCKMNELLTVGFSHLYWPS